MWSFVEINEDSHGAFKRLKTHEDYEKDESLNTYYQMRNRGASFAPPVIGVLLKDEKFVPIISFTPNLIEFLVLNQKYFLVQTLLFTEPNSESEIEPTKKMKEDIKEQGFIEADTGIKIPVFKTILVGLGG